MILYRISRHVILSGADTLNDQCHWILEKLANLIDNISQLVFAG